jgi:antitoxin component YwqK of YwqJK toxin-antitoxin module
MHEYFNENGYRYYTENYKGGFLDGEKKIYSKNPPEGVLLLIEHYKEGNLDGEKIQYDDNGVIAYKGSYLLGKKNGYEEEYNSKGILVRKSLYSGGILKEEKKYPSDEIDYYRSFRLSSEYAELPMWNFEYYSK